MQIIFASQHQDTYQSTILETSKDQYMSQSVSSFLNPKSEAS